MLLVFVILIFIVSMLLRVLTSLCCKDFVRLDVSEVHVRLGSKNFNKWHIVFRYIAYFTKGCPSHTYPSFVLFHSLTLYLLFS